MSTSTIYVKHTSRIHASRPANFGPHFSNPDGQPMNLIPIESYLRPLPTHLRPSETQTIDPLIKLGCPPSINPPPPTLQSTIHPKDWIALIERGLCPFIDKVRYAQRLGAAAVIVGDRQQPSQSSTSSLPHHPFSLTPIFSQASTTKTNHNTFGFNYSDLLVMYAPGDTSDISIPSVFVARDSYLSLKRDWNQFSIISHHPPTHSLQVIMSKDELWTWPFFDLVIVLLFLPSILTIVTLLLHRISTFRKQRADRAPKELVNRLPSVIWAKDMEKGIPLLTDPSIKPTQDSQATLSLGWLPALYDYLQNLQPRFSPPILLPHPSSEQTPLLRPSSKSHQPTQQILRKQRPKAYLSQRECALCLSDFEVGDLIRILPCGHCFHQSQLEEQCMGIDCWLLKSKRFCPICRMSIVEEPELPSETSTLTPILHPTTPIDRGLVGLPSEPIPLPANHSHRPIHSQYSQEINHAPIPSSSSVTLDHACSRTHL